MDLLLYYYYVVICEHALPTIAPFHLVQQFLLLLQSLRIVQYD